MRLNEAGLQDKKLWEEKGYKLPKYDREAVAKKTKEEPFWIHFGAGNIFRAFQANVVQRLLQAGVLDRGLIVAEGFDYEIIEKMNRPQDDYNLLVTLKVDGNVEKTVIGSVVESCILDAKRKTEYDRLKEIFENPTLQMATFTITEKGYSLTDGKGELLEAVKADFEKGVNLPVSYLGKVTSLLYHRYKKGAFPLAMVSMDNCSHNGDRLLEAVTAFGEEWTKRGLVEKGFLSYLTDEKKISFPWTMIDKITPRPDASIAELLKKDGIENLEPVITSKNTYVAPFVNAEECEYLVIEDKFPNGRPRLEEGGFLFTERETVDKVEKMKVCTCLNPLHTALAVFGCLLGYEKISEEMKDQDLKKLVELIGYKEGLPVVVDPGVLTPREFIDTVLKVRLPNPFMPDTPQRIATDTSQKLSVRFGETIKAYEKSTERKVTALEGIPLVFAGWIRYLMAVDDEGKEFVLSPDPLLDSLCPVVKELKLGEEKGLEEKLRPILERTEIFGVDLYKNGMADKVTGYVREMLKGTGAVRSTLKGVVGE